MLPIELKAQLKIIQRLLILISWVDRSPIIQNPLEYLYNQLIGWEKSINAQLQQDKTTPSHNTGLNSSNETIKR
jgi:hypothetical protein